MSSRFPLCPGPLEPPNGRKPPEPRFGAPQPPPLQPARTATAGGIRGLVRRNPVKSVVATAAVALLVGTGLGGGQVTDAEPARFTDAAPTPSPSITNTVTATPSPVPPAPTPEPEQSPDLQTEQSREDPEDQTRTTAPAPVGATTTRAAAPTTTRPPAPTTTRPTAAQPTSIAPLAQTQPTRSTTTQATRAPAAQPTRAPATQRTTGGGTVSYKNCAAVRAAGKAPLHRGQPGYGKHLDRDGDGIACE